MKSRANTRFWELFRQLPAEVQDQARETYRIFTLNPRHPGLQFKRVSQARPVFPCAFRVTIARWASYRVKGSSGTGSGTSKTTTGFLRDTDDLPDKWKTGHEGAALPNQ